MFYKIGDKYYVKMSNYYQEVEIQRDNIVPKKGEESRIYNPNSKIEEFSYKQLLEINNKKKIEKKNKFDVL